MLTISFSELSRLIRLRNLTIIAIAQFFTAAFLIPLHYFVFTDWKLIVLSLSTLVIAASGYIINDYYDIKIDLINKPERVVIGKSITRRIAILSHTVLSLIGILLGFLVSWKVGIIHFCCASFLWLYSNHLKRLPLVGNLVVAILTGVSIELINILYEQHNRLIFSYSLFAFFMTLIREIIKDIEDMKGDSMFGCKTIPIILGLAKTKWLLYLILFLFLLCCLILNWEHSILLSPYFFILLLSISIILILKLNRADTKRHFYAISQYCKVMMLLGILSMPFI